MTVDPLTLAPCGPQVPDDILRHGHLVHCMEMLYGIVTVFRDMRFLIDGCFHLSAPKEEHKLKLSMEYVWKAAFLTMGHLYGRYPRLLVGVHSVLSGAPQAAGSRGFLSPLAASPTVLRASLHQVSLGNCYIDSAWTPSHSDPADPRC